MPLYWGEIHIHSSFSDGRGKPPQNFKYARNVADLDFASITDHAEELTQEKWEDTKAAVENYNDPGNFVTLLAFEWTQPSGNVIWKPLLHEGVPPEDLEVPRYGHRNIYYKDLEGDYFAWNDPESDTPEKLWERLREQNKELLVIPHHPASYIFPVDWDYHNPEFERLVEIYSMWGSSEMPVSEGDSRPIIRGGGEIEPNFGGHVRHALNEQNKVGIIAGSDGHDGCAGKTRHHINNLTEHEGPFYPSGITGVYAEELTREAIWNALWDRRVYGTTGSKIEVKFSINGNMMGSEIETPKDGELLLESKILGTTDIQRLEIIKNGQVIKKVNGNSPEFNLQETMESEKDGTDYFYIKVIQTDQEMAWSSPIWVD